MRICLAARLVGHQAVGAEEFDHKPIESSWIFDVTGMARLGQDFVYGAGNQRSGFLAADERVVVFTVDHQRRNFHRAQTRRHVEPAAGAKNLANGLAGKRWIAFNERIQQIFAELRIGEIGRHQSAQMLDVILFDADFRIAMDSFLRWSRPVRCCRRRE